MGYNDGIMLISWDISCDISWDIMMGLSVARHGGDLTLDGVGISSFEIMTGLPMAQETSI